MKSGNMASTKQGAFISLKYDLEIVDVVDEKTVDKFKMADVKGIAQFQYVDKDGKRSVLVSVRDFPTLSVKSKEYLDKASVLRIMKNLAGIFASGATGVPVSYIVRDTDYIYVNPDTQEVTAILLPIKQDVISVAEISMFFRDVLSNMRFAVDNLDNYVAKLFNYINIDDFSASTLVERIDALMKDAGISDTPAPRAQQPLTGGPGFMGMPAPQPQDQEKGVKVNRMDVMRNRASMQNQMPYGMPGQMPYGMPGQMPQGMPGQMPQGMPGQMPQRMPGQMPQGMPGQAPQGMPGQMPQGMPGQMPQGMPGQMPQGMPGQMPQGMPGQMPQGMPGQMPQGMPGQMPQGMSGQAPQGMPGQAPQGMPGQAPNNAPVPPMGIRPQGMPEAPVEEKEEPSLFEEIKEEKIEETDAVKDEVNTSVDENTENVPEEKDEPALFEEIKEEAPAEKEEEAPLFEEIEESKPAEEEAKEPEQAPNNAPVPPVMAMGIRPQGMPNPVPGQMPQGMPGQAPNNAPVPPVPPMGIRPQGMPGQAPNNAPVPPVPPMGIRPQGMPGQAPNNAPVPPVPPMGIRPQGMPGQAPNNAPVPPVPPMGIRPQGVPGQAPNNAPVPPMGIKPQEIPEQVEEKKEEAPLFEEIEETKPAETDMVKEETVPVEEIKEEVKEPEQAPNNAPESPVPPMGIRPQGMPGQAPNNAPVPPVPPMGIRPQGMPGQAPNNAPVPPVPPMGIRPQGMPNPIPGQMPQGMPGQAPNNAPIPPVPPMGIRPQGMPNPVPGQMPQGIQNIPEVKPVEKEENINNVEVVKDIDKTEAPLIKEQSAPSGMPVPPVPMQQTPRMPQNLNDASALERPVPHFFRKGTGEEIFISKDEFKIGRSKAHADYAVENNSAISRVHCVVVRKNGVNYLKDNDSQNGTYIDGRKLSSGEEVLLKNKAVIRLGDEEFIFRLRKGE